MHDIIATVAIIALPLIFAITVHEAMHGYAALKFGDKTAYRAGRITLNPIKHIDPVGTIAVPIALMVLQKLSGGAFFIFGWAKPVPVNFAALNNPKRDMLWVALAGPASNIVMAILWAYIAFFALQADMGATAEFLKKTAGIGVTINIIFAGINLLPILPLDGGRIVASLLPSQLEEKYALTERYGFFILLALIFFVPGVIYPIFNFIGNIVMFFVIV